VTVASPVVADSSIRTGSLASVSYLRHAGPPAPSRDGKKTGSARVGGAVCTSLVRNPTFVDGER